MNCLCNLFDDDVLWIILIVSALLLACSNCGDSGSARGGCGCGC